MMHLLNIDMFPVMVNVLGEEFGKELNMNEMIYFTRLFYETASM
jgi:hypothetical protein